MTPAALSVAAGVVQLAALAAFAVGGWVLWGLAGAVVVGACVLLVLGLWLDLLARALAVVPEDVEP